VAGLGLTLFAEDILWNILYGSKGEQE
jgi:hypothetical protein